MGQFGRITSISDLPAKKVLAGYVRQAMKLNEDRAKSPPRKRPRAAKDVVVPDDLQRALRQHAKARATFENFSPSNKREYVEWITEAKTEDTRNRRLVTAIEWMSEGKPRNWKYMRAK
jgi:uncharacterized protein YdeI (YjbR/CyaY-like superfamily)